MKPTIIKTNSKYGQALIRKICDFRLTPTQQQSYNKLSAGFKQVRFWSQNHTTANLTIKIPAGFL